MKSSALINNERFSYTTLLSSDDFLPGVVMLDWSLKRVNSKYPLHVLCSDSLSEKSYNELIRRNLSCQRLNEHVPVSKRINKAAGYSHWNRTFDKLYVWTLTQFDKVVYLDSDMQVIANIDHLFDCPHMSAVRADAFNEPGLDKLNSGLMVIEPNESEFLGLRAVLDSGKLHLKNMGDQDVIRIYYRDWGTKLELTLPSGLNVFYSEVSSGVIRRKDVDPVSVIHYIGHNKPWMISPRAVWRRSRKNFLGKYLLNYALALYWRFPSLLFVKAKLVW